MRHRRGGSALPARSISAARWARKPSTSAWLYPVRMRVVPNRAARTSLARARCSLSRPIILSRNASTCDSSYPSVNRVRANRTLRTMPISRSESPAGSRLRTPWVSISRTYSSSFSSTDCVRYPRSAVPNLTSSISTARQRRRVQRPAAEGSFDTGDERVHLVAPVAPCSTRKHGHALHSSRVAARALASTRRAGRRAARRLRRSPGRACRVRSRARRGPPGGERTPSGPTGATRSTWNPAWG